MPNDLVRVLLVDVMNDGLGVVVARCLQRARRYEVHCLTSEGSHDLQHSSHARVACRPFDSSETLLAAIEAYVAEHPVDLLIPMQELALELTAPIAQELPAPARVVAIPSAELCEITDDKWSSYELLVGAGIPTPRSLLPGDRVEHDRPGLEAELASWGCESYLIKPLHGFGGNGIEFCASPRAIVDAWIAASDSADDPFLIQETIPGGDIDCSFLAVEGRVVAGTVQEPFRFQYAAHASGLGLDFREHEGLARIMDELARATNWSGVAHLDLRRDERTGAVSLIEINPRYWQTLLGSLAMGVNFPDLHCRLALGEPVDVPTASTGRWYNTHAITMNIQNLKVLRRDDFGPVFRLFRHEIAADPRLELYLLGHMLAEHLGLKLRELASRFDRSPSRAQS